MKNQNIIDKKHPFSADRPIGGKKYDLLSRAQFAEKIALALSNWSQGDSLVTAIYGKWGDGKTSVKNMIIENLRENKKNINIIEFNPWQWQDQKSLLSAFFDEIQIQLGKNDSQKNLKKAARKWQIYSARLQLINILSSNSYQSLSYILGLTGIAGFLISLILPDWSKYALCLIAIMMLIVSITAKFGETFTSVLAKLSILKAQEPLEDIKQEVSQLLSTLDSPIIIIIDDIDRLQPNDIETLIQIIKTNADFPNLIYLLFSQRDILEKSLSKNNIYHGSEYLEKIVQVAFDLPPIKSDSLHNILLLKVEELLKSQNESEKFQHEYWNNIFTPGLSFYFKNLRDINRFISTFSFQLGMLRPNNVLEVNPVDLVAVETLRLFEPFVYESIHKNHSLFTANPPRENWGKEINKKIFENCLALATNKETVKKILIKLFPNVRWCVENYHENVTEEHRRDLRICSESIFNRYFTLSLSENEISEKDIQRFFSSMSDKNELTSHLLDLHAREILSNFIVNFDAYKTKIDIKYAENVISAFFNVGEIMSYDLFSECSYALRIIYGSIESEKNLSRKKEYILNNLNIATTISLPSYLIGCEIDSIEEKKFKFVFQKEDLNTLKSVGLKLIHQSRDNGLLNKAADLARILNLWQQLENLNVVQAWLDILLSTEEGIIKFLRSFTVKSYKSIGNHTQISLHMDTSAINKYINFNIVATKIASIDISTLNEDDKKIIFAALEAQRRT